MVRMEGRNASTPVPCKYSQALRVRVSVFLGPSRNRVLYPRWNEIPHLRHQAPFITRLQILFSEHQSRLVQTRHSQGQHRAVRDRDQDRQVCLDRPWFPAGNNSGPRGHQPHQPGRSSISKTPRCSSRSRKGWGFEAFSIRITGLRARNWLPLDCRMTKE